MKPEIDYLLAFLAGILGSLHCIGMCGGLVSAFFLRLGHQDKLTYLYYHVGRILIYAFIGIAAAFLGMAIETAGLFGKVQGILQVAAGVAVIIIGLDLLRILPWRIPFEGLMILSHRIFNRASPNEPLVASFMGGVLNGFMPCGLVYAMAIQAVSTGEPLKGGALMIFFGLGTLPSMLSISLVLGKIGNRTRNILFEFAATVVIVMGVKMFYTGIMFLRLGLHHHHHL